MLEIEDSNITPIVNKMAESVIRMHCKLAFNFALRHELALLRELLIGLSILIPFGQ